MMAMMRRSKFSFPAIITFLITLSTKVSCILAENNVHILTTENFLEVTEGKNVFIKFYTQHCSRCRAMEDDWNRLGDDFENHEHTIIGQVDCTADDGKAICEEYQIQTFPTLMYGNPWSADTYAGQRDYDSLYIFAQEKLSKPMCSIYNTDSCSDEDKETIASLKELSIEDLEDLMTTVEDEVKAAEEEFDEKIVKIQQAYDALVEEFNAKLDGLKDAYNYRYMEQLLLAYQDEEEEL